MSSDDDLDRFGNCPEDDISVYLAAQTAPGRYLVEFRPCCYRIVRAEDDGAVTVDSPDFWPHDQDIEVNLATYVGRGVYWFRVGLNALPSPRTNPDAKYAIVRAERLVGSPYRPVRGRLRHSVHPD